MYKQGMCVCVCIFKGVNLRGGGEVYCVAFASLTNSLRGDLCAVEYSVKFNINLVHTHFRFFLKPTSVFLHHDLNNN